MSQYEEKNVLGGVLKPCCHSPKTGFYRDGFCRTGKEDIGEHTICIIPTAEFLEFSKRVGNDLSTPAPQYGFLGVKPGEPWCLCASRWIQAYIAGAAPKIVLEATHESMLLHVSLDVLQKFSANLDEHDAKKGLLYHILR